MIAWFATVLRRIAFAALLAVCASAYADDIEIRRAILVPSEEGYALDADFDLELSGRLDDALHKGLPLYFVIEFECARPRWYWFDDRVAEKTRQLRLTFHALTRTYRVSGGALQSSYTTLDEALRVMSRVRGWQVIEKDRVKADSGCQAALRMRLDVTQLPKPLQPSALANREWNLSSGWKRWSWTPQAVAPAALPTPPPPSSVAPAAPAPAAPTAGPAEGAAK